MAKLVSKTYGDALFAVALEEERMEELFEAVKVLTNILRENDEFGKLINHPKISKEEKVKIVEDSFSGRVPKEIIGVMTLLVSKGRAGEILSVFDYFMTLVKEEKKIGIAQVTTAITLKDAKQKQIEQRLLETTQYESLEMTYCVDPSLIGGMIIRIGDRVVDSSVKTKLYDLSKELRKIQLSL